jgi:hypothetical protein
MALDMYHCHVHTCQGQIHFSSKILTYKRIDSYKYINITPLDLKSKGIRVLLAMIIILY